MAATVNSTALYTASEEEDEDDVVEYFAAAFQDSEPSLGLDPSDNGRDQGVELVILEGDRAGDEEPPILSTAPTDDSPLHPIPRMQAAFEESILESGEEPAARRDVPADAKARHLRMLDEEEYNSSYNLRFRRERRSRHHPLWKLMAQIAFGVHLLHQQLAKSDAEVIRILQTHVDEVDRWVETTKEDLEFCTADIRERILHLRTPLEHVHIFESMLEDPDFRSSILDGNQRIERMVTRTSVALKDNTIDIHQGKDATLELAKFLENLVQDQLAENSEMAPTLRAMKGNAEGWIDCCRKLQGKANTLGLALQQLRNVLAEMAKRAGTAGRKSLIGRRASATDSIDNPPRIITPPLISRYSQSNQSASNLSSLTSRIFSPDKPLPPPPPHEQDDMNRRALVRNSAAIVGREYPYPPARMSGQLLLRRPRTTEDLGMRTETSLWDAPDDDLVGGNGASRNAQAPHASPRTTANEGRRRSRSRTQSRPRSRAKSGSDIWTTFRSEPKYTKTESNSNLRAKWTAKLKGKGSTLSLALQRGNQSRGESLHKTLARTWSLRSPKPDEIVDRVPSMRSNSIKSHSRKDSASSFHRHRTVAERARGPWSSAASDSVYARRSYDARTPDQFTRTQSPQLALDVNPTDSRVHSPAPSRPLPTIISGSSPTNSRRTSQALALAPQSVSLSPVPPSTRSQTPKSSRPTMSWGKSSMNDVTTLPGEDTEREYSITTSHHKEESWTVIDYRQPLPERQSRLPGELPPHMTSPNAKKKLGMLKNIFRWRIERVNRSDGRQGSRLEVIRG